ncbi:MAG: hypothetical protein EBY29_02750 [Planctomycetes bacterium]|nr:hypothetical protein [Planctomycetota bacterium]
MSDCIPLATIQNFASKDVNRIIGQIGRVLARKSPYINSIDGGTLPNVSDVVRSVVEEMAVPNASLASPQFFNDVTMCGVGPTPDRVGTTEYTFQLQTLRGAGPRVCVKQARTAFKGSYLQAQIALEKNILQLINADIRYQYLLQSGIKFVVDNTKTFSQNLSGDMQVLAAPFATGAVPNAPMNFKTLYKIGSFLREEMLAEPFATSQGEFFQVMASADQIENFRNDADVKEDLIGLTTGSFKLGEQSISGYQFQGYRGFAFGIDQQPLRASGFDGSGNLILVNPTIAQAVTNGFGQRRNPAWVAAPYEVMFVVAGEAFKRLVPESYTGEGTFRFAPQLAMGELEWTYFRDNDCNLYGDFGQHIYQIQRAIQPVRPQNVCAIVYKRCLFDGLPLACATGATGL